MGSGTKKKPRIALTTEGRWYVSPGKGEPKKARNLRLVPAISFCNRLNAQRAAAQEGQ